MKKWKLSNIFIFVWNEWNEAMWSLKTFSYWKIMQNDVFIKYFLFFEKQHNVFNTTYLSRNEQINAVDPTFLEGAFDWNCSTSFPGSN